MSARREDAAPGGRRPRLAACAVALVAALAPLRSAATLGEKAASVARDRAALAAAGAPATAEVRAASGAAATYTVHTFDAGGSTVREYVSADGTVFAVTWVGRAPPDLDQVLGTYASALRAALASEGAGLGRRASRQVTTERLVARMAGHARRLSGRVWDPELLPEGVTADAIQ